MGSYPKPWSLHPFDKFPAVSMILRNKKEVAKWRKWLKGLELSGIK